MLQTDENTELLYSLLMTINSLAEHRGNDNWEHAEKMERLMDFFVEEIINKKIYTDEMNRWDIKLFLQATILHDVGKIAISDEILKKSAPLTREEFEQTKKHTTSGEMIIERMRRNGKENTFFTHAKILAGTHHEKWDGSGYPLGTSGTNIPLHGRIMAIVDNYDALVSGKPYRKAFSHNEAIEIIKAGDGNFFDPALMAPFLAAVRNVTA